MIKYFNSFKKNAFRVETLQSYNVDEEQEAYDFFLKNKKLPDGFGEDWCDIIKKAKTRGAKIQRVHLINFPIDTYISFELEVYKKNIKAGEEIYYIPLEKLETEIKSDFWIFDDNIVLEMYYDKDGTFLNFKEIKDDSDTYIQIKNYLLKNKKDIKELF